MNRNQRRKFEKQNVTHKDLKAIEDHAKTQGIDHATSALLASVILTLHDKWGWGQVRITRLLGQIDEQFDAVTEGRITIQDLRDTVKEELGINLK